MEALPVSTEVLPVQSNPVSHHRRLLLVPWSNRSGFPCWGEWAPRPARNSDRPIASSTTAEDLHRLRPFYRVEPVARSPAEPPASTTTRPSSNCNRIGPSSAGKVNQNTSALLGKFPLVIRRRSINNNSSVWIKNNCRRPTSEYIESRDEYLYDEEEIDFRLRLDSAVEELLESDSFSGSSPCSSADHSPNLADKGRLNLVPSPCDDGQAFHMLASEDHDNVSDESGYSDDKDVISSSSSASDASTVKTVKGAYTMAEEFTLNLWNGEEDETTCRDSSECL